MITEIRRDSGYWDLFVDGVRVIERESYAVVDKVRHHLQHPEDWDASESAEVADKIREWRGTW